MLLAEMSQWIGLGAGMLILSWVMIRRRLRGSGSRTASSYSQVADSAAGGRFFRSSMVPPNRLESERALGLMDAPTSIARWEVAMHDVARDLRAELDTKMAGINALLVQSREECTRLAGLIERAERMGISPARDTLQTIEDLGSDNPQQVHDAIQSLSAVAETNRESDPLPGVLVQKIYDLADQGRSTSAIAKQLGAPLGDVEFALNLRSPTSISPRE